MTNSLMVFYTMLALVIPGQHDRTSPHDLTASSSHIHFVFSPILQHASGNRKKFSEPPNTEIYGFYSKYLKLCYIIVPINFIICNHNRIVLLNALRAVGI